MGGTMTFLRLFRTFGDSFQQTLSGRKKEIALAIFAPCLMAQGTLIPNISEVALICLCSFDRYLA